MINRMLSQRQLDPLLLLILYAETVLFQQASTSDNILLQQNTIEYESFRQTRDEKRLLSKAARTTLNSNDTPIYYTNFPCRFLALNKQVSLAGSGSSTKGFLFTTTSLVLRLLRCNAADPSLLFVTFVWVWARVQPRQTITVFAYVIISGPLIYFRILENLSQH